MLKLWSSAVAALAAALLFASSDKAAAACPPTFSPSTIASDADCIFRDWSTDGAPASGAWNPRKSDIRQWGEQVGANIITKTGWTPADVSGANLTFSSVSAIYVRRDDLVTVLFRITYPTTSDGTNSAVSLPIPPAVNGYNRTADICYITGVAPVMVVIGPSASSANFFALSSGAALSNASMSGLTVNCRATYSAT